MTDNGWSKATAPAQKTSTGITSPGFWDMLTTKNLITTQMRCTVPSTWPASPAESACPPTNGWSGPTTSVSSWAAATEQPSNK